MLSICISDKGLMVVDASLKNKKMVVKKFARAITDACDMGPDGFKDFNAARDSLVELITDFGIKKKGAKAYVTIDSASIVFDDILVPEKDSHKANVDLKQYMARYGAKASAYVADYRLNGHVKVDGKNMSDVSVIFVYGKVIADIARLMKSVNITPVAMDVAQNSSLKIISKCIMDKTCKFDNEFVLFDFKGDFITLYLYQNGVKMHTENFPMNEKPETKKYFMELKSKLDVIMDVADKEELTPTNIYVTGEIMQIKWALQKLANVMGININQLPRPKKVVEGVTNLEFNEYYAPIGTLLRSIK